MAAVCRSDALFPAREQVKDSRQYHAQRDRGCQREVESCVLAPINDISWQLAKRQVGLSNKKQQQAGDHENRAEKDQEFADFSHDFSLDQTLRSDFRSNRRFRSA